MTEKSHKIQILNYQTVVKQPRSFLHSTGHTQTKLQETQRKGRYLEIKYKEVNFGNITQRNVLE